MQDRYIESSDMLVVNPTQKNTIKKAVGEAYV